MLCTTIACLAPNDNVNWGAQGYGAPGTSLSTPQPWLSTASLYDGFVGVVGPTNFTLMQQSVNWNGNFDPGDYLIWNQDINNFVGNAGPIRLLFTSGLPVYDAGAAIQADFYGPFEATICAYGIGHTDCWSEAGVSNGIAGSAIIIGVKEPWQITTLDFTVVDINGNNDEAIGTLYLSTSSVPEPGTIMLLGSGVLGLAGMLRRKISL
jgi:hypothetical protein